MEDNSKSMTIFAKGMHNYTFFMKLTRFLSLSVIGICALAIDSIAQDETVRLINEFGRFDSWSQREVKESSLIGGATKYLYEFYGVPGTIRKTGKEPFSAPEGYLWRTNNVLAIVAGIVKTNNTVYPEKR